MNQRTASAVKWIVPALLAACPTPTAVDAPVAPACPADLQQIQSQALAYCDGKDLPEFECVMNPLAGEKIRYVREGCACPIDGVGGFDPCVPGTSCRNLPGGPVCSRLECTRASDCTMLKPPSPDGRPWNCENGGCVIFEGCPACVCQ